MSFPALAAVSKMHLGSAAEKLIALAYADRHNEETGCAYPSLAWLCEFSSLNRKTVIAVVARLEGCGFLSDTGKREGRTGQIKVYKLSFETVPKTERFQKRNSSSFSGKESQKRDTDTVKEPVSSEAKASSLPRKKQSDWQPLPLGWEPTRPLSPNCQAKVDLWPPGAFNDELESFRSWAANAAPVKGKGLKKDWDDAFGNWIRSQNHRYASRFRSYPPGLGKTSAAIAGLGDWNDDRPM